MFVLIAILECIIATTVAVPVTTTTTFYNESSLSNYKEVTFYLQRYGYLDDNLQTSSNATVTLNRAISLFQEYFQLPGDGTLNNVTLQQMRKPRCGLPDIPHHALVAQKWPKTHLTWNFHLVNQDTINTAEAAFALWAEHSSLTFERKNLNPDILIAFRTGVHTFVHNRFSGDICPDDLDGPGNVLAHATYPSGAPDGVSEVHVDRTEPWHIYLTEHPLKARSLVQTLAHEIGHSLGLPHGTRNDSVMFPFAPVKGFPVKLGIEDILAIQQLYGVKDTPVSTPTTETTTITTATTTTRRTIHKNNDDTDLCDLQYVDTVLILDHRIFIAHKRQIWSIDINDKKYEKPLALEDYMNYLPVNLTRLQAAYQRPSGDIVLFAKDSIYTIEYPSFTLKKSWPRTLADIRLPPNAKVNAAINTNKGRTFIIFNDNNVAEIDECSMRVKEFHTLQAIFPGIPSTVTSAFRYTDGNLYFINERQFFFIFNEFSRTVTRAGKFDLSIIDIECPRDGILRQLRDLLNRLVRFSPPVPSDENYL